MEKSSKEKEDQFEWWITCIPDKVISLKKQLPAEVSSRLDYSIESLDTLENYFIRNYTIQSIQNNKELWDCLASYLGTTYRRNVPNAVWYIELKNDKDIFYNMPVLIVKGSPMPPIVPHSDITALLSQRKGNYLTTLVNNHIKYANGM